MLKKVAYVVAAILLGTILAVGISSVLGCGGSGGSVDWYDAGMDTDTDIDTDSRSQGMWECLICNEM